MPCDTGSRETEPHHHQPVWAVGIALALAGALTVVPVRADDAPRPSPAGREAVAIDMAAAGKSTADVRADALRSWRERPRPDVSPSLLRALLPIVLAQALDFVSTEEPIGFLRRDDMVEHTNVFPGARGRGFAGTAGRVASGGVELLLAALLHNASPGLSRAYAVPSISTHVDLARHNLQRAHELDLSDRRGR